MDAVEFSFLVQKDGNVHIHADIELFFVLDGAGEFTLEDKKYSLKKEDFIVINSNQKHSFHSLDENFLGASIMISYVKLSRMIKKEMIFFVCNSSVEENEITEELRNILHKIVSEQYQSKDDNEIYMSSLYYELLHILTTDFQIDKDRRNYCAEEHKFDDRKYKITQYVQQNYDKDISLGDLAEKLYLSVPYLSKYIKRQFGMNFIDYVNSIRLNYAVSQLLYSDKPLVRIAMDTGFASSAALNKVFKEKYNMTPTEYRGQWKEKEMKKRSTVEETEIIQKQVKRFFKNNTLNLQKKGSQLEEYVVLNQIERIPLNNIWTKMINIGAASDLLHSDVQQHVLYLKNTLHFRYVRFWDMYSDEVLMRSGKEVEDYNFDKLDRILDFLTKNDLIPYMELRIKPKILIQNRVENLQFQDPSSDPGMEFRKSFMKRLIIHLINRYTASEIEKWYFEIWKTELGKYQNAVEIDDMEESIDLYLDVFDSIADTLRHYLPGIQVGGGGFALRWGEEHFCQILKRWKKRRQLPDYISVYCYPYTQETILYEKNQTLDVDFVQKYLTRVWELMEEAEFPVKKLHVTEWSFSVSSRNILNDHCMKGAYLVKNMIDSIGMADFMGYWVGSDLFADFYDSRRILNGGGGLVTKDGIPKPAYYALEFINHLGKYLLKKGSHYVISDNGKGNYRIVCHNLKSLGYQYGLLGEDKHKLDNVNNLFTDTKKNLIHFELPAQKDGKYVLRVYSINRNTGSILDEWMEMAGEGELMPEDLVYLKRITIPKMIYFNCEEKGGKIRYDALLEPNEIRFIHVSFKYAE